jgi:hypothetical protein
MTNSQRRDPRKSDSAMDSVVAEVSGGSKPRHHAENSKAVHKDGSHSTHAHKIKVIMQDGQVIFRGPVCSDNEKSSLDASGR